MVAEGVGETERAEEGEGRRRWGLGKTRPWFCRQSHRKQHVHYVLFSSRDSFCVGPVAGGSRSFQKEDRMLLC
jgi:hypothetical protein